MSGRISMVLVGVAVGFVWAPRVDAAIPAGNIWPNPDFESVAVAGDQFTAEPTFWSRGGTFTTGARYGTGSGDGFPVISADHALLVGEADPGYSVWISGVLDLAANGVSVGSQIVVNWYELYNVTGGTVPAFRLTVHFDEDGTIGGTGTNTSFIATGSSVGFDARSELLTVTHPYMFIELVSGGSADATGDMFIDDLSVVVPVPAPAALPGGLALLAAAAMRRRG